MNSSLLGKLTSGKENPSSSPSWLEKHWDTTACLLGIFVVALIIRSYFAYEAATKFGLPYLLGGGADSYYNARIINYIAETHHHLFTDPLRGYPLPGLKNTRPPLYQWSVVLGGYLLSPFVGSLEKAINISFIFSSAFWSAMTVFPVYLIGKKTFGKKAGIAAALMLTLSAAHLGRGVLTNTNHDAFSMFWIVTGFFFFMRSLEEIRSEEKWVSDWMKVEEIKKGLAKFFGSNRRALLYSAMTGMVLGALALTWKGYSYALVIILVYFLVQIVIDKFRKKDSLGITVAIFVMMMIAFFVALPWYAKTSGGFALLEKFTTLIQWPLGRYYQIPFVIFLGTFAIGAYFSVTRDLPWVLTFSILILAGVLFFTLGPNVIRNAASQYFIQNKLYSTIAEAQAPSFSRLVLSTGLVTSFLSFIAIPLAGWHLKKTWRRSFLFVLVWLTFAIYMATTATRFIFNAAPAFALTSGWMIALMFDKANFSSVVRGFKSHRGNVIRGIREGVKIKHVLVTLFVVFLILTPNALYAIDAGIPFQEKQKYNEQVYRVLPQQLRPDDYDPDKGGLHYLGAFGYSMDRPTQYWPGAWDWFSQQDDEVPPKERPAFVSWWDYGFECINRGKHPTVADNFQHGYRFTGNVLMSQNESEMMALLVGRQLQLPYRQEGAFEGKVRAILVDHIGKKKTEKLENIYEHPNTYKDEVLSNPDRYHPRAKDIGRRNVMWAMVMGTLSYEDLKTLNSLYRDISYNSGYERLENRMGYIAVDSRMFPTSGRDTGIFHAPAYLSGHRMKTVGRTRAPVDFYSFEFIDARGRAYDDPEEVPEGARITRQRIKYKQMFFNTALYRIFAGFGKHEVGEGEKGIPGLSRTRGRRRPLKPMPSWNMTHFKTDYRTAYFNPYPNKKVQNHSEAWEAISYDKGIDLQDNKNVTVDLSSRSYMRQGVIFVRYYDGAILKGQVETEGGEPIPNAKVTVYDTSGNRYTPHHVTTTDSQGNYRAILPPGNVTVLASTGGGGREMLKKEQTLLGNEQYEISEEQALRRRIDRNGDGRWDYKLQKDFEVKPGKISGKVFLDRGDDGSFDKTNDTLYQENGKVKIKNKQSDIKYTTTVQNGTYEFSNVVPGNYTVNSSIPGSPNAREILLKPDAEKSKDIPLSVGKIGGNITYGGEVEKGEITLSIEGTDKKKQLNLGETDSFEFLDLPFGKHTLSIEDEGYALRYGPSGYNIQDTKKINRNLQVVKAYRLEGRVTKEGEPLTDQKLTVLGKRYDRVITTDQDGQFSIKVPKGRYQIYGINREGEDVYVTLDDVTVDSSTNYHGKFEKGYRLTGSAVHKGEALNRGELFIRGRTGEEYYITTNPQGRFKVYLPKGFYELYGWKKFGFRQPNRNTKFYWEDITLDSDTEVKLDSSNASLEEGKVIRDIHNSEEEGEGIFTDIHISCGGRTFTTSTTIDGNYSLYLPNQRCTFTIDKEGYHKKVLTVNPVRDVQEDIYLNAKNVSVEGDIDFDRESVGKLTLRFVPEDGGAVAKEITVDGNEYSVDLQPGDYKIVSDHFLEDSNAKYEISDSISIEPGEENIQNDLSARYRVKVQGDIEILDADESPTANIYFQGLEDEMITANGSYATYLIPGNYSVRAVHPRGHRSVQKKVKVEGLTSTDFTLEETYSVDAKLKGLRKPGIPVYFRNKETGFVIKTLSGVDGELNLNITSGNYEITVNHVIEEQVRGVKRKVKYHLTEQHSTPISGMLELEKKVLHSTLRGEVKLEGSYISGADIEIKSDDKVFDVQSNENGKYSIDEVIQGRYTVYASYQAQGETYTYFESFKMPAENKSMDITLEKSHILSGKVTLDGKGIQTGLKVVKGSARKQFDTSQDGTFRIELPKGRYSITASETREMKYGTTEFQYSASFELNHDESRNIQLKKVKEYGIKAEGLETKQASQGEVIEYTVQISNTGNTPDEYGLSAEKSKWDIDFTPQNISLQPNEKAEVNIRVKVGENATVGETVKFTVTSHNSDKKVKKEIPINIKQIHRVDLYSEAQDKKYGNGKFTYSVKIKNGGNGQDSYQIEVANRKTLKSSGWNVTVPNKVEDVGAHKEKSVEVKLRSISSKPKRSVKLELMVVSEGDSTRKDTETFTTTLPEITGDRNKVGFSGTKMVLEKQPFKLSNWHWGGIVILVAIVALYVMKKKRWL